LAKHLSQLYDNTFRVFFRFFQLLEAGDIEEGYNAERIMESSPQDMIASGLLEDT
jgi:hypothetical protein